jgi:hypothetical protein
MILPSLTERLREKTSGLTPLTNPSLTPTVEDSSHCRVPPDRGEIFIPDLREGTRMERDPHFGRVMPEIWPEKIKKELKK